jgi:hypothetical protein
VRKIRDSFKDANIRKFTYINMPNGNVNMKIMYSRQMYMNLYCLFSLKKDIFKILNFFKYENRLNLR